jgi:flagellar hook-associated protein 1 FlgK
MGSTFAGLGKVLTSLNASRYGLDAASKHSSNASTPGCVRQRAELAETGPATGVARLEATEHPDNRATVSGTSRPNDPVIDMRARSEHGRNSNLHTAAGTLSVVEDLFDEPSDNGLAEQLNDFWNSWASVANNPGDSAARNAVLQRGRRVAGTLNQTGQALARISDSLAMQRDSSLTELNTTAGLLAQLNGSIATSDGTDQIETSLLDQRDSLLMRLSELTGAQSSINPDGSASVSLGDQTVVSSTTVITVSTDASNSLQVADVPVGVAGGSLQSLLDSLTTTLPSYTAQLDAVAAALAATTNSAQAGGYDLAGNPGGSLFSGATAASIGVAITDPSALAASATPGGNLDGSVALAMSQLGSAAAGPDISYRTMIGTLAAEVQRASQQANVQQAVTNTVDTLADASSAVSIDDQTTNLLTHQRAYQASSRVLTAVDETLQTLINHTGTMGL